MTDKEKEQRRMHLIKRLDHLDKPEHAGIRAVVQKEIDALAPKLKKKFTSAWSKREESDDLT